MVSTVVAKVLLGHCYVLYEVIQPGGPLTTTTDAEHLPGYPDGATAMELLEDLTNQASLAAAIILWAIAMNPDLRVVAA